MILDHPGQKLKLCLAAHHGNFTPPRISPSCPFQDRSTNAGAVIARQIGHDLLSGRSDPLPTLLAAFMQIVCTGGSSRSLQCRCPFSVFTRHTNGCISVSGYSLEKVREKAFSGSRKSSPHYLSSFANPSGTKNQKLPIMSNNILSFDRILLRCLLTPLCVCPTLLA